jgi:nucleotide-binding universal stress UspA family protein
MNAAPDWNSALRSRERPSKQIQNVVLAVEDTPPSRTAIPVARAIAKLYDAALHVAYLGRESLDPREIVTRLRLEGRGSTHVGLEGIHAETPRQVSQLARDLPQALIVMSTETGEPSPGSTRFRSAAESILSETPDRIMLLADDRGERPWSIRHILLAHDGTPACRLATCAAGDLAQHSGAQVTVLHVAARQQQRPQEPGSIPAPLYVDQPQHEWPAWAQEFMNRMIAAGAPAASIHFRFTVRGGQPGSEIAQAARDRDSDLVVMAWHGHWDRDSCATRVAIRTCRCPVLLLHSAAD